MKKGLFNKQYGLQNAVVEGWKTNTRRICKNQINPSIDEAKWKVGEIIAVAQSYEDAGLPRQMSKATRIEQLFQYAGWNNAMFVRADLMPHYIKITNVRVERLQDISEEDCLKEGVYETTSNRYVVNGIYLSKNEFLLRTFTTARAAFATLIDKISGKGTWDSNPFVYAYEFELVK